MSTPTSLWCYCSNALKRNAGKVYIFLFKYQKVSNALKESTTHMLQSESDNNLWDCTSCHFQTFNTRVLKQTYLHSSKSDSCATRRSSCSPRFCLSFWVSLCPLDVIFLKYIFSLSIVKNILQPFIQPLNLYHAKLKSAVYYWYKMLRKVYSYELCTTCR